MKKTIQIPEGNEFSLFIPFVVFSASGREDASAALWNNLQVVVRMSNSTANVDCTYSVQAQYVVVSFGNDLKRSSYDVIISGEYERRKVCAPLNNHFAITAWADGNYAEFVVGQPIICPTQTIIGQFNTTQDIEDLTEELRAALVAAEAAKAEYEEKVEELSDVAQQTTLTEGVAAIREDISHINIDTTTIAKQGTNASATLTATQTAATNAYASAEAAKTATVDGNDTAIGVAKEVRSEVGTGSDTAAETGTLFAVVKWVKDKVKSIFNLIGSPASGQPATLFAAIAAGGGGGGGDAQESTSQAILAEIGSAGSGQSPTLFGAIGDVALSATTLQSLADSWAAMVTNRESLSGYTFASPNVIGSFGDILARRNLLKSVSDDSITIISAVSSFSSASLTDISIPNVTKISGGQTFNGCSSLPSISLPNLQEITGANTFSGCTILSSVSLPNLENLGTSGTFQNCSSLPYVLMPKLTSIASSATFSGCTILRKVSFPKLKTIHQSGTFQNCLDLIDIEFGSEVTASINISTWSPTNALSSSSTSLVDEGETFSSNLEKLLYNIREHIAANLPNRTGLSALTMTFSSAVKAAINANTATAQAFTSKNWTIA